jgi:hypothetical protein
MTSRDENEFFLKTKLKTMKKSILAIGILISGLFISAILITGCGGKKEHAADENQQVESDTTKQQDEMAMVYACSMHPEITGKEGDSCSKCGMKLELVKNTDSTEVHEH